MEEIWKDIPGFENAYQASNLGRIRSLDRIDKKGCFRKGKILAQYRPKNRYYIIALGERNYFNVHRLIALTFLPNPECLPQINHKDCNKANNHIDNLEWVSPSDNTKHAHNNKLIRCPTSKPVNAFLYPQMKFVAKYESINKARLALGVNTAGIYYVLYGKIKQTKGYTFKFAG